ncbi:MAG: hypothetical protein ABIH21_02645 [Patescibacteria group bacterium]
MKTAKQLFSVVVLLWVCSCASVQEQTPEPNPGLSQGRAEEIRASVPTAETCTLEFIRENPQGPMEIQTVEEEIAGRARDSVANARRVDTFFEGLDASSKKIPSAPQLPDFPSIKVVVKESVYKVVVYFNDPLCEVRPEATATYNRTWSYSGDWRLGAVLFGQKLALIKRDLAGTQADALEDKTLELVYEHLIQGSLWQISPIADSIVPRDGGNTTDLIAGIVDDEQTGRVFMDWVLRWLPEVAKGHEEVVRRILSALWKASSVGPGAGDTLEAQYALVEGEPIPNLFRSYKLRGTNGQKTAALVRFWIVSTAFKLGFVDVAQGWGQESRREIAKTKGLVLGKMYVARLDEFMAVE